MFINMVYYQRYHLWRKGDVCLDEESHKHTHSHLFVCENSKRIARPKLLFLVLLSFISFSFILAPLFFTSAPTLSLLCKFLSFLSFSVCGFFNFVSLLSDFVGFCYWGCCRFIWFWRWRACFCIRCICFCLFFCL